MASLGLQKSTSWKCLCLIAGLCAWMGVAAVHAQEVTIRSSTISSGGSVGTAGEVTVTSVVGQMSPVGEAQQNDISLRSGFMHTLTAEPPLLEVESPAPTQPGSDVLIEARLASGAAIQSASLRYRPGGASSYSETTMEVAGNTVRGAIPADAVTERGVGYHIRAIDREGRIIRVPTRGDFSVEVVLPERGVVRAEPLPGGDDQTAYRIVSVPLDLENKDPEAVFGDELGSYNPTRWRFFELRSEGEVIEYPDTSPMEPGSGFWLISREGGEVDTGPGTTVSLDRPFRIQLRPGWNLIGNPFNFDVPIENIRMESGQELAIRSYDRGFNDPLGDAVTLLRPFEGYAVYNDRQSVDALLVDPDVEAEEPSAVSPQLASTSTSARPDLDWFVHIDARVGRARSNATAAVSRDASDDWDALDHPAPPVIGNYVSVDFPRPDWDHSADRFTTDVRAISSSGHVWPLEVRTNMPETITLNFSGIDQLPEDFEAWLLDERVEIARNLRASPRYEASTTDAENPLSFRLVVGTSDFVDHELGELREPAAFEMAHNFPNPFTHNTTIRYGIPEEEHVRMYVYDALGRHIATLADGEMAAGYHTVVWDGRDRSGAPVASGTYFVRLQAGSFLESQSVTIVR